METKFIICALGIFLSYFFYGIVQEKITKSKYGVRKEKYCCILGLILFQCIVNIIIAFIVIKMKKLRLNSHVPRSLYLFNSFSYMGAMFCSNYALKHVNYPTQVVGKAAKPIPVMILGVLWSRKSYPLKKYIFVFMITLGVILFLMQGHKKSPTIDNSISLGVGEMLLILSLTLDGLTGAIQDEMRTKHTVSPYQLMFNLNVYSLIYLIPAFIVTNEYNQLLFFVWKYPEVIFYIILFGLTSALGQIFIFTTITNFGPLSTSIITTTRKFFTILASIIIFRNPITNVQILSTFLVFIGLFLDQMYGKEPKKVKV